MRISDWSSDVCSSDLDGKTPVAIVADCNKNTPFRFLLCVGQAILCLLRQRPDVVISTGALPGFAFVMVAHVLRIRTIWVDSVANAEDPSLAGQKDRRFSTLWLSQWSHVADQVGGRRTEERRGGKGWVSTV